MWNDFEERGFFLCGMILRREVSFCVVDINVLIDYHCLHFPFIHCRLLICFEIESAHISLSVNLQAWEMLSAKNKSQLSCHNIALV